MSRVLSFRSRETWLLSLLLCLVVTALACGAWWLNVYTIHWDADFIGLGANQIDAKVYWRGGQRLQAGEPLYTTGMVGRLPFTYPPFAGILFVLLAGMSFETVRIVVECLTIAALIVVILVGFHERGNKLTPVIIYTACALAVGAHLLHPIRGTIFFGQINIFLMALVATSFTRKDHGWYSGIGVGLATGLKLTPGFFMIVLLIQRRWAAFCGSVAAVLSTIAIAWILLPEDSWDFWTRAMWDSSRIGSFENIDDQSIKAVVFRLLGNNSPWWYLCEALVLALVVAALVMLRTTNNNTAMMALGGWGACLLSPFSWHHHYVWVVPLTVVLVDAILRYSSEHRYARALPAAAAIVLLWCLTGLWIYRFPDNERAKMGIPALNNLHPDQYELVQGVYVWTGIAIMVIAIAWGCGAMIVSRRRSTQDPTLSQSSPQGDHGTPREYVAECPPAPPLLRTGQDGVGKTDPLIGREVGRSILHPVPIDVPTDPQQ